MFSLTRYRKAPTNRTVERVSFAELPDDILILICSACPIDELWALRRTDRRLRSLISEYVNTIAPAVVQTTFPRSHNLLLHKPLGYSIRWLEDLVLRQLAAILVDRHRIAHDFTEQRYGIPAEDVYGDELRARIANGWGVLRRLSGVSNHVRSLNTQDSAKTTNSFSLRLNCQPRKLEQSRQQEDLILEQRLAYIESMPMQDAKDYKLMFMLLSSSFRTSMSNVGENHKPWVFDWGNGIDGQRLFRKGSSWLAWFVLAEGPDLFWNQWWTLPCDTPETRHYIRNRAINAWTDTPQKLVDHQRDHARKIQEAINDKAEVSSDFVSVNPIPYFTQYAELRLSRWKSGVLPVKETMSHVPFHIEFRCPKELVQQHKLFLQGRDAAKNDHVTAR